MKKRILSIALALILCLSLPATALATEIGTTYDIWVGDKQVTDSNASDVLNDGTVSYNADENTLTLSGAAIAVGYEYDENRVAGIYATGDLNIELEGTNSVTAPNCVKRSYGIRVKGDLSISGSGNLTAKGGSVTGVTDGSADYIDSIGIYVSNQLSIYEASVTAIGSNVTASGDGAAYSSGVNIGGSLDLDFGGTLNAVGGFSEGTNAYSSGIEAYGGEDDYINIAIHYGSLTAEGSTATGIEKSGSAGLYLYNGGLYVYGSEDGAPAVKLSGGSATSTSNDEEIVYAYSNGVYVYAGDVGIDAGSVEISGDSWNALNGDGHAIYARAAVQEDEDGYAFMSGGHVDIACGEVSISPYSPALIGTVVTITAANGYTIYAEGGIDVDNTLTISSPESGVVAGQGKMNEETYTWDYYTIVDADGVKAKSAKVEPLGYKVIIEGLGYDISVLVPAGLSLNEAYCEMYEVEDFSEILNTEKDGYTFQGFFSEDGTEFNFDIEIEEDITIEAIYVVSSDHSCPSLSYSDLDVTQWYHEAADYVLSSDLMGSVSTTESTFSPSGTTSRAMVWTVLARMDGVDTSVGETWYEVGQKWAVENGISDGTMPGSPITREQFATILYRYAKYKGYDVSVGENTSILGYKDAADVSDWAVPAMQWAVGAGLMEGDGVSLTPAANAIRCQTAALFQRFCELLK